MTISRKRAASNIQEKKKLIQDIKQKNPEISEAQLSRYNIDDLKKIQMAVGQEYYKDALEKEKGLRLGLNRQKMKYGDKIKKKYQSKGKVTSDKDADIRLAWRYAKAEAGSGGKEASEQDFYQALKRVKSSPEMVRKRLNELQAMGAAGKEAKGTYRFNPSSYYKKMKSSKLQPRGQLSEKLFQYGGMADMSAAPMIKQPQQKKRKVSGFRTKYSKGGGVRSSKYKL